MSFLLTINDTNPIWFYESQVQNCQNGMVGVINQYVVKSRQIVILAEVLGHLNGSGDFYVLRFVS